VVTFDAAKIPDKTDKPIRLLIRMIMHLAYFRIGWVWPISSITKSGIVYDVAGKRVVAV
jgi:hypothetical protein